MHAFPWQEALLSFGNFTLFVGLLPSIFSDNKPSKWTCVITSVVLTIMTVGYAGLSLPTATFMAGLSAGAWWVLFFQTVRN